MKAPIMLGIERQLRADGEGRHWGLGVVCGLSQESPKCKLVDQLLSFQILIGPLQLLDLQLLTTKGLK